MADGDVQEPTEELWIRVKSDWLSRHAGWIDAIWPLDSESDARSLGDVWDRLRDALLALHDQAAPHAESLHDTWTDLAGVSAYVAVHQLFDGTTDSEGLVQLAGHCHELAEACRDYAKDLADIKGEIVSEILINVALFALSTLIAGPAGEAAFVARLTAQIVARVAAFAEKIAAYSRAARLGVGAVKFAGEAALNAGRGAVGSGVGNVLGQELSSLRGYGDFDKDKYDHAWKAGLIGGALGHAANRTLGKAVTDISAKGLGKIPKMTEDAAKQLGSVAGASAAGAVTGAGTNYLVGRPWDQGAIAGAARGGMHALGAAGMKNTYERVTGNQHPTIRDLIRSHMPTPPDGGPPNTPMPPPGNGSPAPHSQSAGEAHGSAEQSGTAQHTEAHSSAEQQAAAQRAEVPLAGRATGTTDIHPGAGLAPRVDAGGSVADVTNLVRPSSPSSAPPQLSPSTRSSPLAPHSPASPARSDAPASAPAKEAGAGGGTKEAPPAKDSAPAPEKTAPPRADEAVSEAAENSSGETTTAAAESKAGEVVDLNARRNADAAAGAKAVEAAGAKKAPENPPPDEPPGTVQRPHEPTGPVRDSGGSGAARRAAEPVEAATPAQSRKDGPGTAGSAGEGAGTTRTAAAARHGEPTPLRTARTAGDGAQPTKTTAAHGEPVPQRTAGSPESGARPTKTTATPSEPTPLRTTRSADSSPQPTKTAGSPDSGARATKTAAATHNEPTPLRTTRSAENNAQPTKTTAIHSEPTPQRAEAAGRDEAAPAELKDFRPKETFAGRAKRLLLSEPEAKLAELSERAAYARDRGIGWLGDQLLGSLGGHPAGPRPGDRWFDVETRRNEAGLAEVLGRLRELGYSLPDLAELGVASRHLALADRMVHRELTEAELKQALVARSNLSSAEGRPARTAFEEVFSRTGDLLAEAKGLEAKAHEAIAHEATAKAETPEPPPEPVAFTLLPGEGLSGGEAGARAVLRLVPVIAGESEALAVGNRPAHAEPEAAGARLPGGEGTISPERVRALPDLWDNYRAQARSGGLSAHLQLLHDAQTGNLDAAKNRDFRLALRDWLAEVPTPEESGPRQQFRAAFDELSTTPEHPRTEPREPVRTEPTLPRTRLGLPVSFAESLLGPVVGPAPTVVADPVRPQIGFPARPPIRTEPAPGPGDLRPNRVGDPVPVRVGDPRPEPGPSDPRPASPAPSSPFREGDVTVPYLPPDFPGRSDQPGSVPDVRYPLPDAPEVPPVVPSAFPYPADKTKARPVREHTEVVPLRHGYPGEAKPLPPVPDEDADERFDLPREIREQLTEQELADLWAMVRATGARPGDILRWIVDKVLYDRVRKAGRGLPHQDASLADKLRFLATEREADRLLVGDRLAELAGRPRARVQVAEEEETTGDGAAGIYLRYGALTTLSFAYAEYTKRRELLDRIEALLKLGKSAAADTPELAGHAYELALKLLQEYLDLVSPDLGFLHSLNLSDDAEWAALGFGGATDFQPRGQVYDHGETIGLAEFSFAHADSGRRNVVVARLRGLGSADRERLIKNARRYLQSQRPGENKPYVVLSGNWRNASEADLADLTGNLRNMGFAAVLYSDRTRPAEDSRTTAVHLDDTVRAESAAAPARAEKPWLGKVFAELWEAAGPGGQLGLQQIAQLPASDAVAALDLLLRHENAPVARNTHFAALGRELARLPEDQLQALRNKLRWLGEWIDGRPPWKQAFEDAQGLWTASGLLAAVNAGMSIADIRTFAPDFAPLHASPDEEVTAAAVLTELALHETGLGDLWQPGVFDAPLRPDGDTAFPAFPVRDATSTGPDYHVVVARAASLDDRETVLARLRRNLAANGAHSQFVVLTGEMTAADPDSLSALSQQLLAEGFDAVAVHRPGAPFEVLAARTNLLTSLTAHAVGPLRPTIAPGLAEWLSGKAAAKHQEHVDLAEQARRATEETEPNVPVAPQPPSNGTAQSPAPPQLSANAAAQTPAALQPPANAAAQSPAAPQPRSNAPQPSAEEAAAPPLTAAIQIHTPLSTIAAARQRPTADEIARRMLPAAAVAAGARVVENGPFPPPSDDTVFLDQSGTVFAFQVISAPNLGYSPRNPITFQVFREPGAGHPLPLVVLRLPDWLPEDLAVLPMAHAMAAGAAQIAAHRRGEPDSPPEHQFWHDRFPGPAPAPTPADLGYLAQVAALGAELDRDGTGWRDRRRMRAHLARLLSYLGMASDDPYSGVRLSALAAHRTEGVDRALAVVDRYRPAKAVEGYRVTQWPVADPAVEIGHRLPADAKARRFDHAPAVEAAVREQIGKAAERTGVLVVPAGPDLHYDVFHNGRHLFTAAFHVLPRTTLESTGVSVHPGARQLSGYLPARLRPKDVEEIAAAALAFGTRYFRTATCEPGTLRPDTDKDRLPESPADRALEARLEVLGDRIAAAPRWRSRRRDQLIAQLRTLLENAGLEKQLPDYSYRVEALGAKARAVVDTFAVERKDTAYPTTAFTIATTVVFEQPATAAMTVALSISGFASGHPGNGIGYFVFGATSAVLGAAMTRRYDIASDKQAALKKKYDEIRANADHGRDQQELVSSWHEVSFGSELPNTAVPAPAQLESDAPDIALPLRTRIVRFSTPPVVALGAAAAVGFPLDIATGSFFALVTMGLGTAVFRPLAEGYSRRRRKGAELAAHDAIRRLLHEYDLEDAKELYRQLTHARAAIAELLAEGVVPDAALAELTPGPARRAEVAFAEHVTGLNLMDAVASFLPYLPDLYKITHPSIQPLKALLDHFTPQQVLAAVDLAKLGVGGWISALADNHLAAGEVRNKLTRIAMRMRAEREIQLPARIRDRDLLLRALVGDALAAVGSANARPGLDPARASELERALARIRSKPPLLPTPVARKAAVSRLRHAAVITAKSAAAGGFTAGLSVLAGAPVWGGVAAAVAGLLAIVGKPYYRNREILTDDRAGTPVEQQSDRDAVANGHVIRLLFEIAGRQQGEQPVLPAVTPLSEFEPLTFTEESLRSGKWSAELREKLDALDRAVENELGHWGFRPTLERRQTLLRDELPRLSARAKAQLTAYEGSEHGFLANHLDATLREYLRTGEGNFAAHVAEVVRQHETADAALLRGLISVVRQYEGTGTLAARLGDLVREHARSRQLADRMAGLLDSRPRDEEIAAYVKLLAHWHENDGDGQLARQVRELLRQPTERLPGELRRLLLPFEHERTRAARFAVATIRELNGLLDEYQAASDPMRFARLEPPAAELPEPEYRSPGQVLAGDLDGRPAPARTVLGLRFLADVLPEGWAKRAWTWSSGQLGEARKAVELELWFRKKNGKYTLPAVTADTAPASVLTPLLREEVPLLREVNPHYRSVRLDRYRYRSNCVSATSAFFHRMAGWDTTAVPAGAEPETLAALWERLGGTWEAYGSEYDRLIAALTGRKGFVGAVAVRSLNDDGTIARHVSAVVVSERTSGPVFERIGVPIFVDPMTGYATKLPLRALEIHLLPVDLDALRSTEPVVLPPAGLHPVRPAERTEGYYGKRLRAVYDVLRQSPQFAGKNLPPLPAEQQSPPVHVLTHPVFHLWRRSPYARATRTHALPAIEAGTVSKSQAARFVREAQPGYDRPDPNAYGVAWNPDGTVNQSYLAYWFGGFWFHSHDSYDSVIIAMAERPLGARALLQIVTTDRDDNEYHQLCWVAHGPYGIAFFDRLEGTLLRLPEYPARLALLPFTDAFLPWPDAPPEYQPAAGKLYVPDPPAPAPVPGVDLRRPYGEPQATRAPAPGPMWTPGHRDLARDPLSSGVDEGRGVKFSTPGPRRPLRPPTRQSPHPAGPSPDPAKPARYGPYHRLESRTQSAETAKLIEESSQVWGKTPRHGANPAVQAWNGPLPPGKRGVEFYTDVKPHFYRSKQGLREWRAEQGIPTDGEFAKLDVVVTGNTQVEAPPEPAENVILAEAVAEVEARGPEAVLREDALAPPPRPLEPTPAQAQTLESIRENASDAPPVGPPGEVAGLVAWLARETTGATGPGSVRFDRVSWIYQALEVLRRDGPARITGVEDGFAAPDPTGHREIRVSLRLPDGRPAELRLGLTAIDEVAGTARALGNFARAVEETTPSSPRDEAVAAILRRRQRELFEQALRRGLPAPAPAEPESFADPDEALLAAAEIVSHVEFGDRLASANETHWLTYADGSQAIYKPAEGESRTLAVPIPVGGQGFRENAMYRLARAAGSDVVPVTAYIDGPRGRGSAQRRIDGLSSALDVSAYPRAHQQEMAYLGYVGASSDCKALSKDGKVVAIDNGQNFPDYADDLIGINSPFVAAWLDRPLDADVLERIRAIDPGWLVRMLRASGMSEHAADEARDRHEEVQRLGRIGGQQWSGRIWNGRNGLARDYR
ncbi:WXG100-like domain-containing protein [Amycolatopsis sp. NPDC054798]